MNRRVKWSETKTDPRKNVGKRLYFISGKKGTEVAMFLKSSDDFKRGNLVRVGEFFNVVTETSSRIGVRND